MPLPQRRRLYHTPPGWVQSGARFFITICAAGRGQTVLTLPNVSAVLLKNAVYYHRIGRWWLDVFLLMPDHVHALLSVPVESALKSTISQWKGFQTKQVGVIWQSGFFDHRLRSDESADEKVHYVLNNPVRAKLVEHAEDWPHAWVQWRDDVYGSRRHLTSHAARPEASPYPKTSSAGRARPPAEPRKRTADQTLALRNHLPAQLPPQPLR